MDSVKPSLKRRMADRKDERYLNNQIEEVKKLGVG